MPEPSMTGSEDMIVFWDLTKSNAAIDNQVFHFYQAQKLTPFVTVEAFVNYRRNPVADSRQYLLIFFNILIC